MTHTYAIVKAGVIAFFVFATPAQFSKMQTAETKHPNKQHIQCAADVTKTSPRPLRGWEVKDSDCTQFGPK